jgi:hypothetical protein
MYYVEELSKPTKKRSPVGTNQRGFRKTDLRRNLVGYDALDRKLV